NGGGVTRDVTVTITGTDDAFVIASNETLDLKLEPNNTLAHPLIQDDGTIVAGSNNTNFIIAGDITGTGTIEIKNNATLVIDGSVEAGLTVLFSVDPGGGADATLILRDPLDFH